MFRILYMDSCGGEELSTSIEHPLRSKERLFLLFDFTPNLKNIFNNFVTTKRYHVPEIANANTKYIGYLEENVWHSLNILTACMRWKSINL